MKEGDIMVTGVGTLGICYVVQSEDKFYFKDGNIIWLKKKTETNSHFVEYAFQSDFLRNQIDNSAGATVGTYTIIKAKNTLIPLPPLPEQKRLVTLLDEAFECIATAKANAQQNLKNARALFESHLNEVFTKRGEGWKEKKIEQIGTTQTGSTPKTSNAENFGDFISFVKPSDFNKNGSIDYGKDGLSELGLVQSRRIPKNSVLMVCIGATIGKCGYVEREVTSNQQINALTPIDGVSYKFIYYQMLTDNFQSRVIFSSGQATLPIINKSKWSALKVSIPQTLVEQEQIVFKLDALSEETQRLEALYSRKIAALDELKKALLHRAFSGEL
jgi:type I restriction enzyme S subunit